MVVIVLDISAYAKTRQKNKKQKKPSFCRYVKQSDILGTDCYKEILFYLHE